MYLLNAFSINMLDSTPATVSVREGDKEVVAQFLEYGREQGRLVQAIGHADTAAVVADDLGLPWVEANRTTVALHPGDTAVVAQYRGPRLAEGTTRLPEGAELRYYFVTVE